MQQQRSSSSWVFSPLGMLGVPPTPLVLRIRSRRPCDAEKHGAAKIFKRNARDEFPFMLGAPAERQICESGRCPSPGSTLCLSPPSPRDTAVKRGEGKTRAALVLEAH